MLMPCKPMKPEGPVAQIGKSACPLNRETLVRIQPGQTGFNPTLKPAFWVFQQKEYDRDDGPIRLPTSPLDCPISAFDGRGAVFNLGNESKWQAPTKACEYVVTNLVTRVTSRPCENSVTKIQLLSFDQPT